MLHKDTQELPQSQSESTRPPSYEEIPDIRYIQGSGLKSSDFDNLFNSFITPALALRAGLQRVDSIRSSEILGRRSTVNENLAGMLYPFNWPGEEGPREYAVRLDVLLGKAKYLMPHGTRSKFILPPDVDPAWLDDPSIPKLFIEGQKKCLAMWRVACLNPLPDGRPCFIPIGLVGVYGWRSSLGFVEDPNGNKKRTKGNCADFDRIKWGGQIVYVLYDTNVWYNPDVQTARDGLADLLEKLGAQTFIATLPEDFDKNGPDDFAGVYGDKAILQILSEAKPHESWQTRRAARAMTNWSGIDDLVNLMFAEWGWSDEARSTYRALNSTWGGRKSKTFRVSLITIAKRLERISDFLSPTNKKQAEREVRRRIKHLKDTIERTINYDPFEKLERGGQVDPATQKRLCAKYRVNHGPFIEAFNLYLTMVEESGRPGEAREQAARVVARRYTLPRDAVENGSAMRAERKVADPDDYVASQIKFEKAFQKHADQVRAAMLAAGKTKNEIKIYFAQFGREVIRYGDTQKERQTRKNEQFKRERGKSRLESMQKIELPQAQCIQSDRELLGGNSAPQTEPNITENQGLLENDFSQPASDTVPYIDCSLSISPINNKKGNTSKLLPAREQISDRGYRGPAICISSGGEIGGRIASYFEERDGEHWVNFQAFDNPDVEGPVPLSKLFEPDETFDELLIERWRTHRNGGATHEHSRAWTG